MSCGRITQTTIDILCAAVRFFFRALLALATALYLLDTTLKKVSVYCVYTSIGIEQCITLETE